MRSHLAGAVALVLAAGLGTATAESAGPQEQTAQLIYRQGPGVAMPTVVRQVPPNYTSAAMRAGIQGAVEVEAVVLADGTVGTVRVTKSLDTVYGLDVEAIAAAKRWQFRPGSYHSQPVSVVVTIILEFILHPDPRRESDAFLEGTYWVHTPGLVLPIPKKQVQPKYTLATMKAKIQGTVVVEAVVMPDGTVGRSRVVVSVDPTFGLDREALEAVNQWTFDPGRLHDRAVPVVVKLTFEFRRR